MLADGPKCTPRPSCGRLFAHALRDYIEARPDLGYAPLDSETYRKGYSLEHLRDLELVRLTSEESLDGSRARTGVTHR